jgi:hypothetical protein
MTKETRSPLKFAPPRSAGQSLSEQLIDNAFDSIMAPLLFAGLLGVMAAMEWWRWYAERPPSPRLITAVAIVAAFWAFWKVRRGLTNAKNLRLGRDGERAVAHYLEWFRARDFFVFHDVPNGDANIDHVLIGPRGVYAIETKTLSKPVRGQASIRFADGRLLADGRPLERDPIVQAKAEARWLYNFFAESQFKRFVQPVVVFPGWFVEKFDMKAAGVWVLEPKALDAFIDNEPIVLSQDEVRAMASALSSYIRSQSRL